MLGFEYKGQIEYITKFEDFRDFMEPSVYEALREYTENLRQKYEDLSEEYEELADEYKELEQKCADSDEVQDELDEVQKLYDSLIDSVQNMIYQCKHKVIPELEEMIER